MDSKKLKRFFSENEQYIIYITVLLGLTFTLSFLYPSQSQGWMTETVENNVSERFVTVNADRDVEVFYLEDWEGQVNAARKSLPGFFTSGSSNWKYETVDDRQGVGMFLDSGTIDGKTAISYQDGSVGEGALYYSKEEDWDYDIVDSLDINGPNVGFYSSLTSLNSQPVIFYQAPSGNRFMAAELVGQEWERNELETNIGVLTDTSTCGEKAFVATRHRTDNDIYLGGYDGEWEMENTGLKTNDAISIATDDCEPVIAYKDIDTGQITVGNDTFGEAETTDISLVIEDDKHLAYHDYQNGLVYATTENEEWVEEQITTSTDAGRFNDLDLDRQGNPHITYLDGSNLKYASNVSEQSIVILIVRITSLMLLISIIFYLIYRKEYFKNTHKLKELKSKLLNN